MVETIRLESGHTLTGIVGSNPTLSATSLFSSTYKPTEYPQLNLRGYIFSDRSRQGVFRPVSTHEKALSPDDRREGDCTSNVVYSSSSSFAGAGRLKSLAGRTLFSPG